MQDEVLPQDKKEIAVEICKKVEADVYISGPAAKNYIDESLFKEAGISIRWFEYNHYPEYNQLYPPFEHKVSILDLIFNTGPNATSYMKSFLK